MSAPSPRIIGLADAAPQPWRNGGGTTRELLAGPDAHDWRWRLSVADIDADGPFSAWPGVQRWFAVLEGAGVELALPQGPVTLRPADAPLAFDGADAPGCRLLAGPTRDLNLMLRGAAGRLLRAAAGMPWAPGTPKAGLYAAAAGVLEALDDAGAAPRRWPLAAATLAWFDAAPPRLRYVPSQPGPASAWWLAVDPAGAPA